MTKVKHIFVRAAAIGCAAAMLAGCSLIPQEEEVLRPPLARPTPETVVTHEVKRGDIIREVSGTGFFQPIHMEQLQFTEAGARLEAILVRKGDKVAKGQVLVQLEKGSLDMDIKRQEITVQEKRINLDRAKEQRDERLMQVRLMELEIEEYRLNNLNQQLTATRLVAGMDGEVVFVDTLKEGDAVPAFRTLVEIADPSDWRLEYQVGASSTIVDVQVGMEALVTFRGQEYAGTVVQTPNTAPPTDNRTLADKWGRALYIDVPGLPGQIGIGDNAQIRIVTQMRENVVKIPSRALRSFLGRNYVLILDGDSRKEVDIEIGIRSNTEIEVVRGLSESQLVILQ